MRKGLLLYNPAAGQYSIKRFVRGIIAPLKTAGWNIEIAETLNGTHAAQTAHQAAREKFDAVFAIGGDGTINKVASGLAGSDTALGVIPAGTANVWALEQGQKPFRLLNWWVLKENARLIANVAPQAVDVGVCNDTPFLLWAGAGLDAETVHKVEPRRHLFRPAHVPDYLVTTLLEATFWKGLDLRIYADGQLVEGRYVVAVATNIRRYAGGLAILSPDSLLDDNQMELWLLSGENMVDALGHMFDLLSGRHLASNQTRWLPFQNLRIESDAPFSIQVDGDPALGGHHAEISIKHRALKVLMPEGALRLLKNPTRS